MEGIASDESTLEMLAKKVIKTVQILMSLLIQYDTTTHSQLKVYLIVEFLQLVYFIFNPFNDQYFFKDLQIIQIFRQYGRFTHFYTNVLSNQNILLACLYATLLFHIFIFIVIYQTVKELCFSEKENQVYGQQFVIRNQTLARFKILNLYINSIHTFGLLPLVNICVLFLYC